ncbi:unnamed protein product [Rhizoctonia solani]|nr:unnamed protein product [Rhizoctonia solani]
MTRKLVTQNRNPVNSPHRLEMRLQLFGRGSIIHLEARQHQVSHRMGKKTHISNINTPRIDNLGRLFSLGPHLSTFRPNTTRSTPRLSRHGPQLFSLGFHLSYTRLHLFQLFVFISRRQRRNLLFDFRHDGQAGVADSISSRLGWRVRCGSGSARDVVVRSSPWSFFFPNFELDLIRNMILGIGVDVCHIPRIARLLAHTRFPARILSPPEHERFGLLGESERARFLAVRWAIKESAYKALYPVYKPTWKDLTFLTHESKKPVLTFHSNKEIRLHASVSHDGEYVFATVLAEHSHIPFIACASSPQPV